MKQGKKRFKYEGPSRDTDLGSAVVYETIRAYKSLTSGELPTSVYVNKIPVLASIELTEAGIPVVLPYSWYKFGPEIESPTHQLRYQVSERGVTSLDDVWEAEHEYRTLVDWKGDPPEADLAERGTIAVREKVRELVVRYLGDGKSERLVDRAYELAPYEFQRKFRLVRINLGRTGRGSEFQGFAKSTDLWTLTVDAFDAFPQADFPTLEVGAKAAQRLVNHAWNRLDRRDARAAADVLEQFWAAFASCLRASPEGHSSAVDPDLVEEWAELASRDTARFTRAAGDIAIHLSKTDPDLRRDELLGELADSRETERRTGDREIDEALEDERELQAMLATDSPES